MSSSDERTSRTHERAILEQENGELAEDVVEKGHRERAARVSEKLDEQSAESFPASDPPSSRIVDRTEVEHPAERVAPDDPVPKTLPRDDQARDGDVGGRGDNVD